MLTVERLRALDARNTRDLIYWAAHASHGGSCLSGEAQAAMPEECKITNEERGELELHAFETDAPQQLFAYVTRDRTSGAWKCTAWPGQSFGRVVVGRAYKSPGFWCPSTRRSVTLYAVNGWVYSGTLYASSGDYARLRRTKRQHNEEQ